MKLSVGAVSRRVIEEAAKLQVHQIVASRAQVNETGGYVELDQTDLVDLVKKLSGGVTEVVRDHGGPMQGGFLDDGVNSLAADVEAGFTGLHIDVCKLPDVEQPVTLVKLVDRFSDAGVAIEIGGEHDTQMWTDTLLDAVLKETDVQPSYVVIDVGTHVWAESQTGRITSMAQVFDTTNFIRALGIKTKAHNMDWVGSRRKRYAEFLDAYNIAPEFARVETDALLTVLPRDSAQALLQLAYDSQAWRRWFKDDEGTWFDRARCAVHYVQEEPAVRQNTHVTSAADTWIRKVIRDAIIAG